MITDKSYFRMITDKKLLLDHFTDKSYFKMITDKSYF